MRKGLLLLILTLLLMWYIPAHAQVLVWGGTAWPLQAIPNGSVSAPSFSYVNNPTNGFYNLGGTAHAVTTSGTGILSFFNGTNDGIGMRNDGVYAWSSGATLPQGTQGANEDTGLSRTAAGVVAVGNGTQGDTTGQLKSTYLSVGSGMAVANVGANSCGTSAATIAGNNNASVITVGATSGTQCRVAFTITATTEWDCAANDDTTTIAVRVTPVDTTHTDVLGAFVAGDKVSLICFAR